MSNTEPAWYRLANLPPLPEPVAHALLKPDGLIDPALVGSKADCEFWSRAEGESQSGWPVVSIHTSDQMRAYGEACAAAERGAWQKWTCRKEWENVNDPPCHPGDKDWHPCQLCEGPDATAIRARGEPR